MGDELPPVPTLGPVLDFLRLLWAVDHGLNASSKRMRAELGVTGLQRVTLRLAGRFPGISSGELARILHVHPSTLTGVLERLVEHGLITRRTDPADRRRALFELTERGKEVNSASGGTVESVVRKALRRTAPGDVEATRRTLEVLADELRAAAGAAKEAARKRD